MASTASDAPKVRVRRLLPQIQCAAGLLLLWITGATPASAPGSGISASSATVETLPSGSLVIPMDTTRQSLTSAPFNLGAYGLVKDLLHAGIPVKWAILTGKARNGIDFTAMAKQIEPTTGSSASEDFRGGPFVVHADFATQAQTVIDAFAASFGNTVAVYELTAEASIDIRYTLAFKPKVAVLDDGGKGPIHESVLLQAGFTSAEYDIMIADSVSTTSCYTIATEPHFESDDADVQASSIREFMDSGGNFLGQCEGAQTYENNVTYGRYQTTAGVQKDNQKKSTFTYTNHDEPFSQFIGDVADPGGSFQDWKPDPGSSSVFRSGVKIHLTNTSVTDLVTATSYQIDASGGNHVFYLGGHDYSKKDDLEYYNGRRMYLNAVFVPSVRPASCTGLFFSADLELTALVDELTPAVGDTVTFTFTLFNRGPDGATNVTVNDLLPAGLSVVSSTPSDGAYDSGTHTWSFDNYPKDKTETLTIRVEVTADGIIIYPAEVTASDQGDPDSTPNNSVTTEDDYAAVIITSEHLPVELTAFEAVADGSDVLLSWATASETNNAGFEIQSRNSTRAQATDDSKFEIRNSDWTVLGWVEGYGTIERPQSYTYRVVDLAPGSHVFRLKQIDFDGTFEYHPEVEVVVGMVERFLVEAAYPNPFNPEAQFRFAVRQAQQVRVELYDMLGRRVKVLYAGEAPAGQMQVVRIDGSDLPSGLYVVRVAGKSFVKAQTVTLIK